MPDTDPLTHGAHVYDDATGQHGTVTDTTLSPGSVYLRPIGGGREWRARLEDVHPVQASEELASRLREARTSGARA